MKYAQYVIPITTTGADGSGAGSATTETIMGELIDIYLDYNASAPNTTDVTIAYATRGGNILVVTSANTDVLLAPRQKYVDNANAAITNSHGRFLLNSALTITIAESNALAPAVTVYIRTQLP